MSHHGTALTQNDVMDRKNTIQHVLNILPNSTLFEKWDSSVHFNSCLVLVFTIYAVDIIIKFIWPLKIRSKPKKVQKNAYLLWHGHTICKFSGKSLSLSHKTTLKQQFPVAVSDVPSCALCRGHPPQKETIPLLHSHGTAVRLQAMSDDEVMLNVLGCRLTY